MKVLNRNVSSCTICIQKDMPSMKHTGGCSHRSVSAVILWSARPVGGTGGDRVACRWTNACDTMVQYKLNNMLLRFTH